MLTTLLSSFLLLSTTATIEPIVDVIHQHRLETREGRFNFLNKDLSEFAAEAEQLNHQITNLSKQISLLSPTADQDLIAELSTQVADQINLLTWMSPALEMANYVDTDLAQLDEILKSANDLSEEQEDILNRISTLCEYIDEYKEN